MSSAQARMSSAQLSVLLLRPLIVGLALWATLPGCGDDGGSIRGAPAHHSAQDHPSVAARADRSTWMAYQSWDGRADRIELASLTDVEGPWEVVHRSETRVLGTALAADRDDALRCVWSEQGPTGWVLREVVVPSTGTPGELGNAGNAATIAEVPGANLVHPVLCADESGALLLTWVEIDGTTMRLMAMAHAGRGRGWGAPVVVSAEPASVWEPACTATGPGAFALVWDAAVDGDYDVYLARLGLGADGGLDVVARHRVTDSPRFEGHASVSSHGSRLYIAYDVAPENWGREGSYNKLEVALHSERQIEVVAVQDGLVAPLAVSPMEGMSLALQGNAERPEIVVESTGSLVLLFRGMPLPPAWDDPEDPAFLERANATSGGKGYRTSIWHTFRTRFDGDAWELDGKHKQVVLGSEGRNDGPIAVTRLRGGGVGFATVGDGREVETRQQVRVTPDMSPRARQRALMPAWWAPATDRSTVVVPGLQRKAQPVPPLPLGEARPLPAVPGPSAPAAGDPAVMPARSLPDGRRVRLALGDLHRHTDISRCSSNWDGPLTDAFRYAFDVGGLQFLAVTDHFEHMTGYDWWRSRAYVDAYHAPERMVNLRAYERAEAAAGHRNVVSGSGELPIIAYPSAFVEARDDAVAPESDILFRMLREEGDVLTIPHTPAGMTAGSQAVMDWRGFDPRVDRLVEVFQGYRGSSEASGAPRAIEGLPPRLYVRPNLDHGLHFGLIAASDHQSTYGAFAGAWVVELTRPGVFESLWARRTFGSTVRMSLWTSWDGVPMGTAQRVQGGRRAPFVVEVDGFGRVVESIQLVVDGVETERREIGATTAREEFTLEIPATGDSYVYARVQLAGGELAWSSPVRLGADTSEPDGPMGYDAVSLEASSVEDGPLGPGDY